VLVLVAVTVIIWKSGGDAETISSDISADPSAGPTLSDGSTSAGTEPGGGDESTSSAPSSTTAPPEPVTLAFAGDTNFEQVAGSPADRIRPFQDLLSSADFAMVNLETAITDGGSPVGKEFTFRAPASVLPGLQENGVDAVSMANNHGMDFGSAGLADSLEAKRSSPIPVLGIGADEDEAFAPFTTEVKGQTVSVIAATQVLDASLISSWTATDSQGGLASAKREERLVEEVTKARASSDIVVVFLHWGVERTTCPSDVQQDLAEVLRAAGADVIVGSHAHRVLGGGRLGDSVVHYGLGNFGFYAQGAEASTTGVFTVTMSGRKADSYQWHPGVIRSRVPHPLTGSQLTDAVAAWDQLRACTNLTP
jgi:poly-gamma-glutamate synthesis protein (capsule biosynthesis protein)